MANEIWKQAPGKLAGYTECKLLQQRIKRSEKEWPIAARYYRAGEVYAVQYSIPSKDRQMAERQFNVKLS